MRSDQIIVELGDSSATILGDVTHGDGPARPERTRVPLRPVALSPEGEVLTGRAARERADESPGAALTDLLERIGERTPCRLGDRAVSAEDVLSGALRRPLSALHEPRHGPVELRLVLPAHWGPHRRQSASEALGHHAPGTVRTIATPVAVIEGARPALADSIAGALVVDAGADRISLTALDRPESGSARPWRIEETAVGRIGTEDVDDALLTFVLARLPAPPENRARPALRVACRAARRALQTAPATEISVPGLTESIRVVRGDLDMLVGEQLRSEMTRTIGRLASLSDDGSHADPGLPVIVIGEFAALPLLVETVSSLLARPVLVLDDPEYAAVEAAARWSAAPQDGADDPDTTTAWNQALATEHASRRITFPRHVTGAVRTDRDGRSAAADPDVIPSAEAATIAPAGQQIGVDPGVDDGDQHAAEPPRSRWAWLWR